jgi:hypothetical protein
MRRWQLIVGWFLLLFLWNLYFVWSSVASGSNFIYVCLRALSECTTPAKILLTAAVIVLIVKKTKRSPVRADEPRETLRP